MTAELHNCLTEVEKRMHAREFLDLEKIMTRLDMAALEQARAKLSGFSRGNKIVVGVLLKTMPTFPMKCDVDVFQLLEYAESKIGGKIAPAIWDDEDEDRKGVFMMLETKDKRMINAFFYETTKSNFVY